MCNSPTKRKSNTYLDEVNIELLHVNFAVNGSNDTKSEAETRPGACYGSSSAHDCEEQRKERQYKII